MPCTPSSKNVFHLRNRTFLLRQCINFEQCCLKSFEDVLKAISENKALAPLLPHIIAYALKYSLQTDVAFLKSLYFYVYACSASCLTRCNLFVSRDYCSGNLFLSARGTFVMGDFEDAVVDRSDANPFAIWKNIAAAGGPPGSQLFSPLTSLRCHV